MVTFMSLLMQFMPESYNIAIKPCGLGLFCVCVFSGAIFDNAAREVRSAFSYEFMNHNADTSNRVKLDANSQRIDMKDSFSLISTSTDFFLAIVIMLIVKSYFRICGEQAL